MRPTMSRALAVITVLALVASSASGCGGPDCESGTLYASLTYDAASRTADTLRVRSTIDGASMSADVPYTGQTKVRVPFPGVAYAKGLSVDVVVEARYKGALVATATETGYVLPSSCGVVPLTFDETGTRFTVSGTVTGVVGTGLVVSDGVDSVSVTQSGPLVFPTPIASGAPYAVVVTTPPANPTETCTVTNGSGSIDDANVTNVVVDCEPGMYTIGGTITGLDTLTLVLELDGAQDVSLAQFGTTYMFSQPVPSGTAYTVTIKQQPSTQMCTFDSNGTTSVSGTVVDANITNLDVTCV
jgi:hypothetical protein